MPTIVVEVMPKAELLDPQGKAVAGALTRTGKGHFDVRVGKRFELTTDAAPDEALLASVRQIAEDVLSNGVIEDVVSITVAEPAPVAEPASVAELAEAPGPSTTSGTATSGPTR